MEPRSTSSLGKRHPPSRPFADAGRGITLELRAFRDGDLEGAWYAIAATNDAAVNEAVVAEAERSRIFCVRADIARDGTAVTPATFEYDGLSVGVLAGGEHRRSAAIRSAIHEALQSGVISDEVPDGLRGAVALVGGGPGDPELITVRGRRLLAQADVVVADRLAPPELLAELAPHVEMIDASKIPYGRAMAQDAINDVLIDRAKAGNFVVRLKGGDPFVFARGQEEVIACADAGIAVTVVPGVSSAIAVPALAGVPVTHRGVNHDFVVVSGHVAPGHPGIVSELGCVGRAVGNHRAADGGRTHRAVRQRAPQGRPSCANPGSGGSERLHRGAADPAHHPRRRTGTHSGQTVFDLRRSS